MLNMLNANNDIGSRHPLHRRTNRQVLFGKYVSMFPHFSLFVIQCRHQQINSTCYLVGESPSFVALMGKFYTASMFPLHLRFLDASMHLYERVCLSVCLSVGLSVRNAFVSNTRKRVISAFEVEGMSQGGRRT